MCFKRVCFKRGEIRADSCTLSFKRPRCCCYYLSFSTHGGEDRGREMPYLACRYGSVMDVGVFCMVQVAAPTRIPADNLQLTCLLQMSQSSSAQMQINM